MKKKSLGFKLVTAGIIAVLIPLMVVGVFSVMKASDSLEKISKEQAMNIAKDVSNMVGLVLQEEMKLTTDLSVGNATIQAATMVTREGVKKAEEDIAQLDLKLSTAMRKIGHDYEVIFVTDADGKIYADGVGGGYKGISVADRGYFQLAKNGKINIGNPLISKKTGKAVVPLCAPILSRSGECVGTLSIILKTDFFADKITNIKIGDTGYVYMVNKEAIVIAHPVKKHILKIDMKKMKGMESITQKTLAQQTGVESYVFGGVDKIAAFAPVKLSGWTVLATQNTDEFLAPAHSIRNFLLIIGSVLLLATILAVLYFARGITRPINRAVGMLNDAADQVTSGSGQVAAASQSLAEGAAESASAIEESSSSLEEMAAMTRKNADNANQADALMKEANQVVGRANQSMTDLTVSMEDISNASEETSKIIKTIDEIAFQTNLLALNAAVEAARAGEAGAGFAVVAEEVRNLAMRAADAAGNTADLIEGTVKKIKEGSDLVTKTNEAFSEVATSSAKVGELVAEIAEASSEQAQGIDQINTGINEMDKVTQQNAANAEESASASEEMSGQAEQLKDISLELVEIVGGNVNGKANGNGRNMAMKLVRPKNREALSVPPKELVAVNRSRYVNPNEIIPMDDEEFKDF
ncbi:MAG: Cache 3/Cache 2 fusion domain-containing protein [Deltaproteobacteria bacterium]|nr:Cache 3/Cache 2 fusion domain-containing protein [Deltaproteobacteria bacterium]